MTPAAVHPARTAAKARRDDIDALRVLAVLVLIYFHTACTFMESPFHIQNLQRSRAATVYR